MNREIKFRAYVKDEKRVFPVYSLDFSWIENEFITVASCGDLNCGICLDAYKKEDAELMQFTGLKDKNGTPIYEGDIWQGYKNFVVEFDTFHAGYTPFVTDGGCGCCSESDTGQLPENGEIIGNIYENPELLEGDSE